jgi:K+-sensing histidine kinase KdpD
MQQLVNDLLDLARLGEKTPAAAESIKIETIYKAAIQDLRNLEPGRKIQIRDSQREPMRFAADLIEQFFANAIANLRKYTPSDAPVRLTVTQIDGGLRVQIEDGGPGIPTLQNGEELSTFKRFSVEGKPTEEGTGLGLSIMAKIAEVHGGSLRLRKSELGGLCVDATFWPLA